MAFWKQLSLLIWKNFKIRRREKARNIIGIGWPLAIFIILVAVRNRRPPENVPIEKRPIYYAPRALPSAGALPFLQSILCNYRVDKFIKEPAELPKFTNTIFNRLVRDLSPILTNQTRMDLLTNLTANLSPLIDNVTKIYDRINTTELPVADLFGSISKAQEELQNELSLTPYTANALSISNFKMNGLINLTLEEFDFGSLSSGSALLKRVKTVICEEDGFAKLFNFPPSTNVTRVKNEVCAVDEDKFLGIALNVYERREEIQKDILNITGLTEAEVNKTFREFETVYEEIVGLESVRGTFSDLMDLIPNNFSVQASGFNLRSVICGGEFPTLNPVIKNVTTPLTPSTTPSTTPPTTPSTTPPTTSKATAKTTRTTTKAPFIPATGGGKDPVCNKIHPTERIDCGWPSISVGQCSRLKCCFDSSIDGVKYCFCPTTNTSSCCNKRSRLINFISNSAGYTPQMVDFLTSALEGKIFYTPDNSKTREIIGKISSFLSTFTSGLKYVGKLDTYLNSLLNVTELLVRDRDRLDQLEQAAQRIVKRVPKNMKRPFFIPKRYESMFNMSLEFLRQNEMYLNASYITEERIQMVKNLTTDGLPLLDMLSSLSECYNLSNFFKPVATEEELVNLAVNKKGPNFLSSIVFLNVNEDQPFPKKIEYKLRLNPDYTPSTAKTRSKYWKPGPGPYGSAGFWHYQYINFGFVFLQDMVDRSLIEIMTNKTVPEPGLYVQQFPYPCFIKDRFMYALGNSMPLFMTLAWIYTIGMIVKSIVYEKEKRLKEVMKVMGLTNSVHWTAWFITSFITMFISIVILAALLKIGDILIYSDVTVVIFVMLIFACASITLAFLISVFFSRANVAAACGGIIYFFTYLPYPLTLWFEEDMNFSAKGAVSLLSTTSFGLSFKYISRWEEQGIGAQWSNLFDNPMVTDTFSIGWAVTFMVIDMLLYLLLMWYFEHVIPGQYGIPKPFYFPFTRSYWTEKAKKSQVSTDNTTQQYTYHGYTRHNDEMELNNPIAEEISITTDSSRKYEREPTNVPVGVHIQNLVKVYSRGKKRAVDGLNLKMYEGHVTALLGHNGAGKSTTMSVLTGLFPPTSGTAVVYGHDIRTNIAGVRRSLGLCPQHNVLFDKMTVEEHMWFYGKLKGLSNKEVKIEIEKFLVDVGLPEKRNELSKNLSGGMKRKLSVAMAFIANSKTVILDEPTSGVDPYSRRSIWDLILKYKKDRTVLLSTHYMDEADLLGDRISIISNGRLQCSGTPLFLKRRFGKGYFLSVTKDMDQPTIFNPHEIGKFIASFIPGAKLHENFGTEVTYILPSAARLTGEFSNLFQNLEDSLKKMGIRNYGISDTTLEEVFLKACDEDMMEILDDGDSVSMTGPVQTRRQYDDTISVNSTGSQMGLLQANNDKYPTIDDVCEQSLSWGPLLWMQQYKAILTKRFHHARRSKKGFFSQILLPAIFVIAAMVVSLIRPPRVSLPSLKLSTDMFGDNTYTVVDNKVYNKFSEKLFNSYIQNPGLGSDCVQPTKEKCSMKPISPFLHNDITWLKPKPKLPTCSCSSGKQQCPNNAIGTPPQERVVATGDTVVDVTGKDINDYLLKTTDLYRLRRYGGATFGDVLYDLPDINVTDFSRSTLASTWGVRRNAKVWYNNKGYHALPTYINIMNNAILRNNINETDNSTEYGIVAYNHPMEFNQEQLDEATLRQGITDLFVAIFVILALAFVPASFLVYLVEDRVSKSKHLQLVSGLNPIVYWLSNFSWDLINYMIPASCCVIIFLAFNQKAYVSSDNIGPTILLLILYGWSMTPLMYPASFVFDVPSTAYVVLIAANLFVGIIGTLATFILQYIGDGDQELKDVNVILKQVFLIFPNYCLGRGLMDLAGNQLIADVSERLGEKKFSNPYDWDVIGRNVFSMFFGGVIYMLLTLLIQYRFFIKPWTSKVDPSPKINEEEDVADEKNRISEDELNGENFVLKTDDLTKLYQSRFRKEKTLAVDRLNFAMKEGECFGLLGVNGAGKTSTFKMLTGDSNITAGDAFVKGHSTRKGMNEARKYMGYCPQFDALDVLLTGKELLSFYAEIRGMSRKDGAKMADWAIETLGLAPYKDKICGDYSGGNKRKLSTAIALLGSPPLIFLDEPTTGMDPGARRFLWNVISGLLKSGKSVVLTSHSMEECETLCTRLAIMVNGKFQCIGSPQHLRSKFGTGYTVIIRSKPSAVDSVQDFIAANFVEAKLKDRHHYMLEYQVPTTNLLLSQVFHKLEMLRKTNTIEDYSVTQTTLDQIFVNFARKQVEAVEVETTEDFVTQLEPMQHENAIEV